MAFYVYDHVDWDGIDHEVCLQTGRSSCVPASIFMLECIKKQVTMAGGEDRIYYISSWFPGSDAETRSGSTDENILQTLKACGLNVIAQRHGDGVQINPGRFGL